MSYGTDTKYVRRKLSLLESDPRTLLVSIANRG